MTTIFTEEPAYCIMRLRHGEDVVEAVPQYMLPPDFTTPWDMTDVLLELFIRPSLNDATCFLLATSEGAAGIVYDNAAEGLFSFDWTQALTEAELPLTRGNAYWEHFLRATWGDPEHGLVTRHLWLGPVYVGPAEDMPPA